MSAPDVPPLQIPQTLTPDDAWVLMGEALDWLESETVSINDAHQREQQIVNRRREERLLEARGKYERLTRQIKEAVDKQSEQNLEAEKEDNER